MSDATLPACRRSPAWMITRSVDHADEAGVSNRVRQLVRGSADADPAGAGWLFADGERARSASPQPQGDDEQDERDDRE